MGLEGNSKGRSTPWDAENKAATNGPKFGLLGNLKSTATSSEESEVMKSTKVKTVASILDKHKHEFKRPMNVTGTGATRVKTFHVRLSETAMMSLDDHINEWLDDTPGAEVKFCNTAVGLFEAKRSEPHLIMNIWY
ncbi:MAG: hypothetical protein AMJ79_12385 [Phycisphaerae bacterium SM23_30]|nr:MAG: hypothetical protein AMJ79_12385 [Phycisphaerae bacterium SM23_30]